MKRSIVKDSLLLPVLIAGLGLTLALRMTAQTFTNLYSFTATSGVSPYTNGDGAGPSAGAILSGTTLYGTAQGGGSSGNGTLFRVNTDGTGFTNLHDFSVVNDGATPTAGLIVSNNTLYGTALRGGSSGNGTVFRVNTDGTGFTNLHNFSAVSDGSILPSGLVLLGNTLYGTAFNGGSSGYGTIFRIETDGTGFTNLHSFDLIGDGAGPSAGVILSGTTLYGTAMYGGSSGNGTVFAINTDGSGFTNLHSLFTAVSEGNEPSAGLIFSSNRLYATTFHGGSSGRGIVFAVNTNGSGFTVLHTFTGTDGANPDAGMILVGNTLCGTTVNGGSSDRGTVFAINTDGSGFTTVYSFAGGSDGANPRAGLILSGNTLYGTAGGGGSFGSGTVFSLSLPLPQLTAIPSGVNVILTWPANATGFILQSTTNLVPPAVWTTNSFTPVVVNGQNAVTNPISGTQQFFRLSQ
jgi:uncharacterized repeat protein (TIGR03803 family)